MTSTDLLDFFTPSPLSLSTNCTRFVLKVAAYLYPLPLLRGLHIWKPLRSLRPDLRSMEMAKGEIPNGPKDDYRDSLREKNGMRCEQPSSSSSLAISILIDEI